MRVIAWWYTASILAILLASVIVTVMDICWPCIVCEPDLFEVVEVVDDDY